MNHSARKGFTLVELLVAIAVFSILISIGVGGFVHALRTQREVAALISAQSNASAALEQITREVRTGYLFCTAPGSSPGSPAIPNSICQPQGQNSGCYLSGSVWTCRNIIDFFNADGQDVDYAMQNSALVRTVSGPNGYIPITGSDVILKYLTFTIAGNTEGDHWPPRITISLGISPYSNDPALANDIINLQTTVSAREMDCNSNPAVGC